MSLPTVIAALLVTFDSASELMEIAFTVQLLVIVTVSDAVVKEPALFDEEGVDPSVV